MAASIEALFMVLGPDMPTIRRSNLSMDKFYQATCSYEKTQLGVLIITRIMRVSLPPEKFQELSEILAHWHSFRKTFVIKEAATMLGRLDNAAGVCDWARFLFLSTRQALLLALRKCKDEVYNNKSFATYIKDAHNHSDDEFGLLRKKFALSKIAKGIWNSKCKCFITKDLKQELMLLESIIKNPSIQWSTPVSHLVKRSPDFEVWGDSSLKYAGGYSHNMKFWWHIEWPTSIQSKTLDKFVVKAKIDEKIISINLLEYCVIIINYAIASHLLAKNLINTNQEYPLLLNWTDNMSAMPWTKKVAVSTPAGKELSKIFCYLCMNNDMACISN